jgi:hypothetical protein
MTPPDVRHVRGSELIYGSDHRLVPSDAFEVKDTIGGNYPVTPDGLSQFLDDLINSPVETNPEGYRKPFSVSLLIGVSVPQ